MSDGGLRVPPQSVEAERGVLGALLLDTWSGVAKVREFGLKGEAFFDVRHQVLFDGVLQMAEEGVPLDALTIFDWLKNQELLGKVGGPDYLVKLQSDQVVCAHVEYYSDLVLQAWIKRELLEKLRVIEAEVYSSERGDEVIKKTPELLGSIVDEALREKSHCEAVDEMMDGFERAAKGEKNMMGLPFPWDPINEAMCGLPVGYGIIAARPSMGKTTAEAQLADFWAQYIKAQMDAGEELVFGAGVGRITIDMDQSRLLQRSASREAGVSLPKIKKGYVHYGSRQWDRLSEAAEVMKQWPVWINDQDNHLASIVTWIRMLNIKHGVRVFTIDYVQQIETGTRLDSEENMRLTVVSRTLKRLARTLKLRLVGLSQLNRGNARDNRRPTMADLRGSGSLEQDAMWIAMLYKDEDVPESKTLRPVWWDIVKQQDGEPVPFPMWMFPNYFRFEPAEMRWSSEGEELPFADLETRRAAQVEKKKADEGDDLDVEV